MVGRASRPRLPGEGALFVAIGILGATVMPHNLYLHSALVQSRRIAAHAGGHPPGHPLQPHRLGDRAERRAPGQRRHPGAGRRHLLQGGAVRRRRDPGRPPAARRRCWGAAWRPIAFAVALLAAGQSSTLTGTLAGQIVMEGFLHIRMRAAGPPAAHPGAGDRPGRADHRLLRRAGDRGACWCSRRWCSRSSSPSPSSP